MGTSALGACSCETICISGFKTTMIQFPSKWMTSDICCR